MTIPGRGRLTQALSTHRDALLSIAIRGVAAVAGFVLLFLIGRRFGAEGNGVYGLVTQTAMLASLLIVGGLDFVVVRRLAAAKATGERIFRSDIAKIIAMVLVPSAALGILIFVGGMALPVAGLGALSVSALATVAVLTMARATTRLSSAVLRALKRPAMSQWVEVLTIPLVVIAAFLAIAPRSIEDVLHMTLAAGLFAAAAGIFACMRFTEASVERRRLPWTPTNMYKEGLPLGAAAVTLAFADWYGLTLVALQASTADAGLYRVAAQIAATIGIVTTGLTSAYAAEISSAHAREDTAGLARVFSSASRLSLALAIPTAIAIIVGGRPLLALMGPEFEEAFVLLVILSGAQILALLVSVAGLALAMTGHGRVHFPVTAGSVALLIIAGPIAAYFWGATGVAVAVALAQGARVVAYVLLVRQRLNINAFTGGQSSV